MSNRSFLVGGTATFAIVLLIVVSLFAAYKQPSSAKSQTVKEHLSSYRPADTKADGPYAAVEHFCADMGVCML